MLNVIKNSIVEDLKDVRSEKGWKVFQMVLAAYNDYQETERDGVDYIFDVDNTEDVICCLNGGMTSKEFSKLWDGSQSTHCRYFLFGYNYNGAKAFNTDDEVVENLISWLDDVLADVLAYPYSNDSYKELYRWYVTDIMIDYKHDLDYGYVSLKDIDALAELKRKMDMLG